MTTSTFAWPDGPVEPATPAASAAPERERDVLGSPRSFAALVYVLVDLLPSILFFVLPVTLLAVGLGLAVIYVGVPILALALLVARFGGLVQRSMALALLDLPSTAPSWRSPRRPGPVNAVTAVLADAAGWRAVGYFVLKLVLAPVTFAAAVSVYSAGLGAISYPLWRPYLPEQMASDGSLHRGTQLWPGLFVDTWPLMAVLAVIGAGVLWCAPRVVGFLTTIDRMLIVTLLSATTDTSSGGR